MLGLNKAQTKRLFELRLELNRRRSAIMSILHDESELFNEVKRLYPQLEYLKADGDDVKFGIKISNGHIHWFSYHQLPIEAEKYIDAWLKLRGNE